MAVDKIFSVAKYMQDSGAGEIILNSVNRDGMMCGYELNLFGKIARDLTIPTIFLGGAKSIDDFECNSTWSICSWCGFIFYI